VSRVLVVSTDVVGATMAGPAIRALELSRVLASRHQVTLATPNQVEGDLGVPCVRYRHETLAGLAQGQDVVMVGGLTLAFSPGLAALPVPIVVDVYPFTQENLQLFASQPMPVRIQDSEALLRGVWAQLRRGDFFLCFSGKLRDFYMGMLHAAGRINPYTYDQDARLRRLIDVVPFGLPQEAPVMRAHGLKGTWPGIGPGDFVVYWGGGLYDWMDPLTAVRAVALAAQQNPTIKLFFPGTRHPNPSVHHMGILDQTLKLAADLGLTGKHVFFNDWVPYERRADFLLDADVGLTLHLDHFETAYSFRTRVLDYIWARLPMVATRGDVLADLIASRGLGVVVEPGDAEAVAQAFLDLAAMGDLRHRYAEPMESLAKEMTWQRCAEPLMAFCDHPARAADALVGYRFQPEERAATSMVPLEGQLRKAIASLRQGGPKRLMRDVRAYLRWRRGA